MTALLSSDFGYSMSNMLQESSLILGSVEKDTQEGLQSQWNQLFSPTFSTCVGKHYYEILLHVVFRNPFHFHTLLSWKAVLTHQIEWQQSKNL